MPHKIYHTHLTKIVAIILSRLSIQHSLLFGPLTVHTDQKAVKIIYVWHGNFKSQFWEFIPSNR